MDILSTLIAGEWVSPDTHEKVNLPIKKIEIRTGIAKDAASLIASLNLGDTFLVVSDTSTHPILGQSIESALPHSQSFLLDYRPEADEATVTRIREASQSVDALIAVGSGTINDLCKYASFLEGKPYAVFGTAASMNGYTSANAAITVKGHKKSLQAHLPQGIFLDLDILSTAPNRLTRSGLGDALCRTTCQADWLLSRHLRDTPYLEGPFDLLKQDEENLLASAGPLLQGNKDAMALLARTLILSGFGMYLASGSYPASEGEHLIAHTMEMLNKSKTSITGIPWPLHGEQIGVTTLTMSRLQHRLLQKRPRVHPDHIDERTILNYFGPVIGPECIEETRKKAVTPLDAEKMNDLLSTYWLSIRAELLQIMEPTEKLENALKAANAPTTPDALGWTRNAYNLALRHAAFMRNRFTFLDLARISR